MKKLLTALLSLIIIASVLSVNTFAALNGDTNGDGKVTDADAIYLLFHVIFPDTYKVSQNCDYNGDGKVTDADAIHLLFHVIFPDDYQLKNSTYVRDPYETERVPR